jgi:predicted SnoaL-like aldol condensation-catalyzing enzyme
MRKSPTSRPLVRAGVGAALLGLGTVAGSVIVRPRRGTRGAPNPARNKAVVRDFYDLAFNQRKPEEAAARYLGPYYLQHNPGAADGGPAFVAFVKRFVKAYPSLHYDFIREAAEGGLVAIHSRLIRKPGDRGMAVMDFFRLENGKIVEHWDAHQEVPARSANSNTMF